MLPLLQIYSCFVMRGTLLCLFSDDRHADVNDAFYSTSRYLDDI